MSEGLIIAIDGPAGSGKSTSAKMLADLLGYLYVDTGAMYRAITLLAIEKKILQDEEKIIQSALQSEIVLDFIDGKTYVKLNNRDVTDDIRSIKVNENVSDVSKIKGVRKTISVYPNPVKETGKLTIEKENDKPIILNIFTIEGKLVQKSVLPGQFRYDMDVTKLEKGQMYIFEIISGYEKQNFKILVD